MAHSELFIKGIWYRSKYDMHRFNNILWISCEIIKEFLKLNDKCIEVLKVFLCRRKLFSALKDGSDSKNMMKDLWNSAFYINKLDRYQNVWTFRQILILRKKFGLNEQRGNES